VFNGGLPQDFRVEPAKHQGRNFRENLRSPAFTCNRDRADNVFSVLWFSRIFHGFLPLSVVIRAFWNIYRIKIGVFGGISSRLVSVPSDYQIVLIGTGKVDCFFWCQKSILTSIVKLRFRCSPRYRRQESITRIQPSYSLEDAETVCACDVEVCWGIVK